MPMVRLVASILPTSRTTSIGIRYLPSTAFSSTGYPTPYIWGRATRTAPSRMPPAADEPTQATPRPVARILDPVQDLGEQHAHRTRQDAEGRVEAVFDRAVNRERGKGQERMVAQHRAADDVGHHAGQHDGTERLRCEVAQDEFHREERAGKGCVERGGDTRGRPAGDEEPDPRHG